MSNLKKILNCLDEPKKFSQLKRDTGLENGVLQHHINSSSKIENEKEAVMLKDQCQSCDLKDICGEKCIHSTLQDSRKQEIINLIDRNLLQTEIAEEMDLSRPTISYHVNDLRDANIVENDSIREPVKKLL
jgi:radical SAM protein with 4Fe4S-binding SPASM domain